MSDLVERARFLAAGQDDPHSVTISELCDEIERLCDDAKEHDRLWAASMKRDHEMFAELRIDLNLPPSRLTLKEP